MAGGEKPQETKGSKENRSKELVGENKFREPPSLEKKKIKFDELADRLDDIKNKFEDLNQRENDLYPKSGNSITSRRETDPAHEALEMERALLMDERDAIIEQLNSELNLGIRLGWFTVIYLKKLPNGEKIILISGNEKPLQSNVENLNANYDAKNGNRFDVEIRPDLSFVRRFHLMNPPGDGGEKSIDVETTYDSKTGIREEKYIEVGHTITDPATGRSTYVSTPPAIKEIKRYQE